VLVATLAITSNATDKCQKRTARYFLQQLAEGLKELRRHNVIHVSDMLLAGCLQAVIAASLTIARH